MTLQIRKQRQTAYIYTTPHHCFVRLLLYFVLVGGFISMSRLNAHVRIRYVFLTD